MRPAPHVLFRCPGRRGLGHLVRGLNIAREIQALAPDASILFYTRGAAAERLVGAEFPCVVETSSEGLPGWPTTAARFAPDVVVDDTLLPTAGDGLPASVRRVYVMRKSKEERHREILASPALRAVDLVVVPHTEAAFGRELSPEVRARTVFVGPIIRTPTEAGRREARARYGADETSFLLTSTAGGGGFAETAAWLFATVEAAHRLLAPRLPGFRHVVVLGPNFSGSLEPLPGMVVVEFEPDMPNLLAASDLVAAEGGYNTVNEVRLARTPAVFLPGRRTYDDQEERVRALERRGQAAVVTGVSPEAAAEEIAAIASSPERLAAMRASYEGDRLETGNRAAAEAILACLR